MAYIELQETEQEYQEARDAEDQAAFISAQWQYDEEVKYQERVLLSHPSTHPAAIFALNWLKGQGVYA